MKKQQRLNYSLTAEMTTMIRDLEPAGVAISVGGEIGEVGGKNSTVEKLHARRWCNHADCTQILSFLSTGNHSWGKIAVK